MSDYGNFVVRHLSLPAPLASYTISSYSVVAAGINPASVAATTACAQVSDGSVSISVACSGSQFISGVVFASYGAPVGSCAGGFILQSCNVSLIESATNTCVGQTVCSLNIPISSSPSACSGVTKSTALMVQCSARTAFSAQPSSLACASMPDSRGLISIGCPSGLAVRNVVFSSWGLQTGSCKAGYAVGSCGQSLSVLAESACIGTSSCAIPTGAYTGFADPCYGLVKQTTLVVNCTTPPLAPTSACSQTTEDSPTIHVSCGNNVISAVTFADYGRPTGSCSAGFTAGCGASFIAAASGVCVGQTSCTLPSGPYRGLGDPCPNVYKLTTLRVQCTAPVASTLTPACAEVEDVSGTVAASTNALCPDGALISGITFADWGNRSGSCAAGYSAGVCNSSSALLSLAQVSCIGRASCALPVPAVVGVADACPAISKKTTLRVNCSMAEPPAVPVTTACASIPDAGAVTGASTVSCGSSGAVIAGVLYAIWGTAPSGSCLAGYTPGSCGVSFASNATGWCVGRTSCVIPLGGSMGLPDPCQGAPKAATIAVRCARPHTAAVAVDANGVVYSSQFIPGSGFSVRALSPASGLLVPLAGGAAGAMPGTGVGPVAVAAGVDLVGGLDVDPGGVLFAGVALREEG